MSKEMSFLNQIIDRNLCELKDAYIMLMVLDRLDETQTLHTLNFFMVAAIAIYRDIITHICLVYEINGNGKSFWYIQKKLTKQIDKITKENSISLENLKIISKKLKNIRNKTYFHIGSFFPNDPKKIWQEEDIKNSEVREIIESGLIILKELYNDFNKIEYQLPEYDGSDVKDIIDFYIKTYPNEVIVSPNK